MNRMIWPAVALMALGLGACNELSPVNTPEPTPTSMQFKQGARYEYSTYHTDASTGQKTDTSETRNVWTLVNTSTSAYGQTGVAIYIDSVYSLGGILNVTDTTYLQQRTNNDIYRYGSLVPELNIPGIPFLNGTKQWMYEAKLNATAANWLVGEVADTVAYDAIPVVNSLKVAVTDSVVGSEIVDFPFNGTTYKATKTTGHLVIGFYAVNIPIFGQVALKTETLNHTTWTIPELGAIVREEREGKVIDLSYQGQGTTVAVPGYVSAMTKVIATGG